MNESYTERGYTGGGQRSTGSTRTEKGTRAGGFIIKSVALLCTFLVLWGLYYATGTGERHKVALAAAGCEPNLLSVNVGCTTVWMLEKQWRRLNTLDLTQLNADVSDYAISERRSFAKAESALTAELTTAKAYETSLTQFPFPPAVAPSAKTLILAIQARIKLTAEQARSSSLPQLRSFNARIDASGAKIQADMALVRKALFTRPTVNQEP